MRTKTLPALGPILVVVGLFLAPAVHGAGLVDMLTSQLGVTQDQAAGGSGAIFNLARDRMSPDEFTQVSDAVPEMDSLLAASPALETSAPSVPGMGGMRLPSMGGSSLGNLGSLSALAGPFSDLGMSPDMIGKFVPVVMDYVQQQGGAELMGMLKNALM
jgi:hypothetical protein